MTHKLLGSWGALGPSPFCNQWWQQQAQTTPMLSVSLSASWVTILTLPQHQKLCHNIYHDNYWFDRAYSFGGGDWMPWAPSPQIPLAQTPKKGWSVSAFENEMTTHTNVYVCLHCYLEHSNVNSKSIIYCLGDRITWCKPNLRLCPAQSCCRWTSCISLQVGPAVVVIIVPTISYPHIRSSSLPWWEI